MAEHDLNGAQHHISAEHSSRRTNCTKVCSYSCALDVQLAVTTKLDSSAQLGPASISGCSASPSLLFKWHQRPGPGQSLARSSEHVMCFAPCCHVLVTCRHWFSSKRHGMPRRLSSCWTAAAYQTT